MPSTDIGAIFKSIRTLDMDLTCFRTLAEQEKAAVVWRKKVRLLLLLLLLLLCLR